MSAVQTTKKDAAIKLRLQGKSYGEILKILNIPSKGTLNAWFKNLELSKAAKEKLQDKMDLARERGLFKFNEERTKKVQNENKEITQQFFDQVKEIPLKDFALIGAALYWAEGRTREKDGKHPPVSFSNSDPEMIKIFMKYLRKIFIVKEDKIKYEIQTHPNISEAEAKRFWSKIVETEINNFAVYNRISKAGQFVRPANFLPYGTLHIRISDRKLFYRIKGYIKGITHQISLL